MLLNFTVLVSINLITDPHVFISFIEKCTTGEIRLNGSYYVGQVQVCVGGVWGAICLNSYWNNSDASVVCKQLGFSPYGKIFNQHNVTLMLSIY